LRATRFLAGSVLLTALLLPVPTAASRDVAFDNMQRKLDHLQRNAAASRPDQSPTEFSEQEINAYLASGRVELPAGVKSVRFQEQPGTISATARVDFDALKAGRTSVNPLLSIFSGVHVVVVVADAAGSGGQGEVHVRSVALDDMKIPEFVLQFFVETFLQPKYPEVGLDSRFTMPERIDTATVGLHMLTVRQK
jgi:hypothetical protein